MWQNSFKPKSQLKIVIFALGARNSGKAAVKVSVVDFADDHTFDRDAGVFHVGNGLDLLTGGTKKLQGGRDCLHWCIVPSIGDLWARGILAAIAGCDAV